MNEPTATLLETKRHSASHVLATAVLELFPDAKLGTGPATDTGFFYDFLLSRTLTPEDLADIEEKMREIIKANYSFEKAVIDIDTAVEKFGSLGQLYKVELLEDLKDEGEKEVSVYHSGPFVDLCRGPHVDSTGEIPSQGLKLERISGAYWKSDENRDQMQRVYGLLFQDKKALKKYFADQEEAKKRDHKKLGKEFDLFYIDDAVGKGLPMWTPKGTTIKHALVDYTRELERKYGYEHVETPFIGKEDLYKLSGHLDHYSSNMYSPIEMDEEKFYLRPMACPHHIRLLQRKPLSYRDLPVRYAEVADYSRFEKSGELMGMIRTRKFQLTDGHLFVTPDQLKEEFKQVCRMIQEGMKKLGLEDVITYRFSKRDPENKEKYFPDDDLWNHAESLMKDALDEMKFEYVEAEDEAAFYGPKLDVQGRNVNGKEDTLFTAQIDFLLPEKFNILYNDKDGSEKRPVMIHRSTIGSLERIFAFLIEHYAGAFPLWLSPVQVAVLPISEKFLDYAHTVMDGLKTAGIRTELHAEDESLGKRIRVAEKQKTPLIAVVGEKEMESETLAMRQRSDIQLFGSDPVSLDEVISTITNPTE